MCIPIGCRSKSNYVKKSVILIYMADFVLHIMKNTTNFDTHKHIKLINQLIWKKIL